MFQIIPGIVKDSFVNLNLFAIFETFVDMITFDLIFSSLFRSCLRYSKKREHVLTLVVYLHAEPP